MVELSPDAVTHLLATYGYLAVLLVVALESMGLPLPGETVLIVASLYAGTTHHLQIGLVIAAAAGGAVLGDNAGFALGRLGGTRIVHRYGPYVRLDADRLRLAERLFARHGGTVVFFGRFVPVLRIWAAFLAGTHGMGWQRFLLCNAAGGMLWATTMGLAAHLLGSTMLRVGGPIGLALAGLGTAAMATGMVALQRRERRVRADVGDAAPVELAAA